MFVRMFSSHLVLNPFIFNFYVSKCCHLQKHLKDCSGVAIHIKIILFKCKNFSHFRVKACLLCINQKPLLLNFSDACTRKRTFRKISITNLVTKFVVVHAWPFFAFACLKHRTTIRRHRPFSDDCCRKRTRSGHL